MNRITVKRRLVLAGIIAISVAAVASSAGPWPDSSHHPVEPLPHPSLFSHLEQLGASVDSGYRLAVFGDQRALADGEWQALVRSMVAHEDDHEGLDPLLAVIDTGDIVEDGRHSDQFHMLADILAPLRAYPYLVALGNHEVHNNEGNSGRQNTVAALSRSGLGFSMDRFWGEYSLPHLRLIILDTNDLVYGPSGHEGAVTEHPRVQNQLRWLVATLAEADSRPILVVLHHPPVASSSKHRQSSIDLWSLRWEGRTLMEILAAGGADLLLTGHTHTYERFRLVSPGGSVMHLVNLSGRPRNGFLWWGAGSRRARDWSEDTIGMLKKKGWQDLEGWQIQQEEAMLGDEQNQWACLHVQPGGKLGLEMFYLIDKGKGGYRQAGLTWLDGTGMEAAAP